MIAPVLGKYLYYSSKQEEVVQYVNRFQSEAAADFTAAVLTVWLKEGFSSH